MTEAVQEAAARRRVAAADAYRPADIALLLVAETPPRSLDRYFYFDDVAEHDSLFRYVTKLVLGKTPDRSHKASALEALMHAGVFLIDIKPDPFDPTPLRTLAPQLVAQCTALAPTHIILIKANVYDAAYAPLQSAGLPVLHHRVPFPGSGQQRRFE